MLLVVLQVPPVVASVKVVLEPAHTLSVPPIFAGAGFTVTEAVVVLAHPPLVVPVIVYTVVVEGEAVTVAPVVAERPVEGAQE